MIDTCGRWHVAQLAKNQCFVGIGVTKTNISTLYFVERGTRVGVYKNCKIAHVRVFEYGQVDHNFFIVSFSFLNEN